MTGIPRTSQYARFEHAAVALLRTSLDRTIAGLSHRQGRAQGRASDRKVTRITLDHLHERKGVKSRRPPGSAAPTPGGTALESSVPHCAGVRDA